MNICFVRYIFAWMGERESRTAEGEEEGGREGREAHGRIYPPTD